MELIKSIKQAEAQAKEIVEKAKAESLQQAEQKRSDWQKAMAQAEKDRRKIIDAAVEKAKTEADTEVKKLKEKAQSDIESLNKKTSAKIVEDVAELLGGMEEIYNKVYKGTPLFTEDDKGHIDKNIDKVIKAEVDEGIISRNLKLVSYECLSRELLTPRKTEMLDKFKHIKKVIEEDNVVPYEKMKAALTMNNIYFADDELEVIYHSL